MSGNETEKENSVLWLTTAMPCIRPTTSSDEKLDSAMNMEQDFPAAHSMDTTWFAVDRKGHVAVFDSGEQGWVPAWWVFPTMAVARHIKAHGERAQQEMYFLSDHVEHEVPVRLAEAAPATFVQNLQQGKHQHAYQQFYEQHTLDLEMMRKCAYGEHSVSKDLTCVDTLTAFMNWMESQRDQCIRNLLIVVRPGVTLTGEAVCSTDEFDIYRTDLVSLHEYVGLHDRCECLGCMPYRSHRDAFYTTFGLYGYSHGDSHGAYSRSYAPAEPLIVSALSEDLRNLMQMIQMNDLDFSESIEIIERPELLAMNTRVRECWRYDPLTNTIHPSEYSGEIRGQYLTLFPFLKKFAESRGLCIEPMEDYPAAHSGDVEWFATDAEGHVAYFNPWSSAPVPKDFDTRKLDLRKLSKATDSFPELSTIVSDELISAGIKSGNRLDLEGAFSLINACAGFDLFASNSIYGPRESVWHGVRVQDARRKHLGPVTVIVQTLDPVSEALSANQGALAPQSPGSPPYVVQFPDLTRNLAEIILRSGQCIACFSSASQESDQFLSGVFQYQDCDPEHGIRGPYFRTTAPTNPVKIDQVPDALRDLFSMVRFEHLTFLESPFLQPLEHFQCNGGWDAYVDVNGRTVSSAPGVVVEDLAKYQLEWNQEVASIEIRREERLRAMAEGWTDVK